MSRPYYGGAEAIDQLNRPSRSLQLSMSQGVRESTRSFPHSRQQNQSSLAADSESEKGGSTRKRISLAVRSFWNPSKAGERLILLIVLTVSEKEDQV